MTYSSAALQDEDIYLERPYRSAPEFDTYTVAPNGDKYHDHLPLDLLVEEQLHFPPCRWEKRSPFHSQSSWEGIVMSVEASTIRARIHPKDSANQDHVEEVEIDIQQVTEGDRSLVAEGALFYLSTGKIRIEGGVPQSSVSIVFRRQPTWTRRDLERRDAISEELLEIMHGAE